MQSRLLLDNGCQWLLLLSSYFRRHSYFCLAPLFVSLGQHIDAGNMWNNTYQLYGQKYLEWQFSNMSWSPLTQNFVKISGLLRTWWCHSQFKMLLCKTCMFSQSWQRTSCTMSFAVSKNPFNRRKSITLGFLETKMSFVRVRLCLPKPGIL